MPKVLCISGMAVAGVILVLFTMDLATGIPFGKAGGMVTDAIFAICAAILGYLSWATYREQD